jgi:hypothetical protein
MSVHWMVVESVLPIGAKSPVTRPGGGSSQAHDTKPEQSDRYGSQAGLLSLWHVGEQEVSESG